MIRILKRLARRTIDGIATTFFPKQRNLRLASEENYWSVYFDRAAHSIETQWPKIIWPEIKDADFTNVLELAPGAGRNTAKLLTVSKTIHAVDLNEYALKRMRARFAGNSAVHIYKNDGSSLPMIQSGSISFIYSWDSAVHFDRTVLRDYIREFARVMQPGATGFVHHSNLGDTAKPDFPDNPHCRSNMSRELFAEYCRAVGLTIVRQTALPWPPPQHGVLVEDCLSVFRK